MTMKIRYFLLCLCCLFPAVQSQDMDRYTYCESCLTAAREIEKAMKEAPAGSRHSVVEEILSWRLCEKILPHQDDHISKDKRKSMCRTLLDSHRDQFRTALMKNEANHLNILLCYEVSHACVGVKRKTFQDSKGTFTETDIDALLQENKENVRIAQPVNAGSSGQRRDEL